MNRKENFIKKATERHNNKYDYSKVEYVNVTTKVCIICPKHGEFWITPQNHLKYKGCPKCSYEKMRKGKEQFIEEARKVHGNKYDYSKVEYVNSTTKVCIICPIHGEFWQKPYIHLNGHNCPQCSHRSYGYTTKEWIDEAKKVHGNKYDYSKVEYVNNHTPVCIICPIHGEFWQKPSNHLNGGGCNKCGKISMKEKNKKSKEEFIKQSKLFFGDWFDYSKVNYVNNKTKVCLICKKHGEFYTRPDGHLTGHRGCPQCASEKNVHETILFNHLKNRYKNIDFFHSKRGIDNLGLFEIDIYDEKNKVAIEYQGDEHFEAIDFFNGEDGLNDTLERDKRKIELCENNGIKLFHFTYNKNYKKDKVSYKVYTDENELYEKLDMIYK